MVFASGYLHIHLGEKENILYRELLNKQTINSTWLYRKKTVILQNDTKLIALKGCKTKL